MAPPKAVDSPPDAPRTFVEVALVRYAPDGTLPRPPRGSETWLDIPGVTVAWSAHLLAADRKSSTMRIAASSTPVEPCPGGERELTVTPHVQPVQPGRPRDVRLDVAITGTAYPPPGVTCAEALEARTTVLVSDQQTLILATQRGRGEVLAITPYLIRSDGDLERILECKRAQGSSFVPAHQ